MDPQRYLVKIVFRGLCLAHKKPDQGLEILLPDASIVPRPTAETAAADARAHVLREAGRLREHHAVLELPQADWENRSAVTPRLLQVVKPTKEPVALYLLKKQRLHFGGLYQKNSGRPMLPDLIAHRDRYKSLGNLLLLGNDSEHGFDQLPGYLCEVADDDDARNSIAAITLLTEGEAEGEAFTERRSNREGLDLTWREVRALSGEEVQEPRKLNLDIVVRFTLPLWNPFRITCEPREGEDRFSGDEQTFLLRPSDPGRGITVWVKNRELSAILLDSDALPDPYEADCPFADRKDRDHALFVRLGRAPENLTLPELADGDASDCGSGCGCTEGRP